QKHQAARAKHPTSLLTGNPDLEIQRLISFLITLFSRYLSLLILYRNIIAKRKRDWFGNCKKQEHCVKCAANTVLNCAYLYTLTCLHAHQYRAPSKAASDTLEHGSLPRYYPSIICRRMHSQRNTGCRSIVLLIDSHHNTLGRRL